MSQVGAPSADANAAIAWAGDRLLALSAHASLGLSGGVYSPCTDSWAKMADPPSPVGDVSGGFELGSGILLYTRGTQTTVSAFSYDYLNNAWQTRSSTTLIPQLSAYAFTGSSLMGWGGTETTNVGLTVASNQGAVYDVASDRWSPTASSGAPAARVGAAAWTGSAFAVWGGYFQSTEFGDGAFYDPQADAWTAMSTAGSPAPRDHHVLVWTGSRLLAWGGHGQAGRLVDGGQYDPASRSWSPTAPAPFDSTRAGVTLWSGSRLLVIDAQGTGPTGWIYDPSTDGWTSVAAPQPTLTCSSIGFQAEAKDFVVTGCQSPTGKVAAKLDPETNQWAVVALPSGAPDQPQFLWTGDRWILWGGYNRGPPPPSQCPSPPQGGCDPIGYSLVPTNVGWTLVP